jgi:hypothetical protein
MRRVLNVTLLFSLSMLILASAPAWSRNFTTGELDELFAPIALYSDPLLAQVLPAATYPDQLDAASNLVTYQGGSQMIDNQPWDVSVRSVAHYPSVLRMMVDSPDWTASVGQAYVYQPQGTMQSIQRLRGRARGNGYLGSNSYQTVAYSNGYTSIYPAQARYMYAPTYNPQVVYTTRRSNNTSNWITFGAGLLIGAWLNNAIDWNHNRVYNHGWNGSGWVARSRPYVQYNNSYYVGRPVTVNRNVGTRNITSYRQSLQSGVGTYRTPGFVRSTSPASMVRPGASITSPGAVRGGVRPGVGAVRTAPTTRSGVRALPSTPGVRPGAVMPRSIPKAGARPQFNGPVARPKAGVTRQGRQASPNAAAVRSTPRANAGMTRQGRQASPNAKLGMVYPTRQASPNASAVRSTPKARAGMVYPTRQASPKASAVRSTPRAKAGMVYPTRQASPKASAVRSTPRGNSGMTRQGRQASPSAPAVRSAPRGNATPRGNAGATRQAPSAGQGKAATRSSGKAGAGKGNQGKGQRN